MTYLKSKRLFHALVLTVGLTVILLSISGHGRRRADGVPAARADSPLYVAASTGQDGSNSCAYSANPCATIQHAVKMAGAGDEIRVAQGRYSGVQTIAPTAGYTYTQVVFITKSVTLRGGYTIANWNTPDPATHATIIDAQGNGRGVSVVGDGSQVVTIEGFTITGGDYTGRGNQSCSTTRIDCGGGLFADNVQLIISQSVITGNIASSTHPGSEGGGLYLRALQAGSRIEDCTVTGNRAFGSANSAGGGGGMMIRSGEGITITHSTFSNNSTGGKGGAINAQITYNGRTALRMDRVWMQGNEAMQKGAAIFLTKQGAGVSQAYLSNLVLSGNRTQSIQQPYDSSVIDIDLGNAFDVTFAHLTSADNPAPTFLHAAAPYNQADSVTVTLTNTLVVSETYAFVGFQGGGEDGEGSLLIQHTHTLADNVQILHYTEKGAPSIVAHAGLNGDSKLDATYHLQSGSAAINTGIDAGVTTDIDGEHRPQGAGYDIGADEYRAGVYLPIIVR